MAKSYDLYRISNVEALFANLRKGTNFWSKSVNTNEIRQNVTQIETKVFPWHQN